jgi:hypothetical protein
MSIVKKLTVLTVLLGSQNYSDIADQLKNVPGTNTLAYFGPLPERKKKVL